jgi:hypothetical protein
VAKQSVIPIWSPACEITGKRHTLKYNEFKKMKENI